MPDWLWVRERGRRNCPSTVVDLLWPRLGWMGEDIEPPERDSAGVGVIDGRGWWRGSRAV